MNENVHAMILAAGLGTRMRPLTERIPKPLVPVAGRALIDYALETVARGGIRDVVVNLHHLGDQIREHIGDGSRFGLRVCYSVEHPLQDTGGGIFHARRALGTGTIVTLNSDTIIDIDLRSVIEWHRSRQAAATLVLRRDPEAGRFGIISTETGGRIGKFLGQARPGASGPTQPFMYTGVQVLEPRVFDYMDGGAPFSITKVTYPAMLEAGEPLYGYPHAGGWWTVGTPEELKSAEAELA